METDRMKDFPWYENAIEPEIRELVYRLRNSGINTVCSCGHEMYVQVDYIVDQQLKVMHDILFNWLVEGKKQKFFNYTIDIHFSVSNGVLMQSFAEIRILPETKIENDGT